MVTIVEALEIIGSQEVTLKSGMIPLKDSLDYYLAQEITSPFDLPPFDNSAMDGFAVCGLNDSFEIIGEVAAGDISNQVLTKGQAVRIFTGGKVPENTTAVIMQEHTATKEGSVTLKETVVKGKNIRRKGEQLKKGEKVFSKGKKINPATLGLMSSLGLSELQVYQKPRIRIIATGNELILPGENKEEGKIFESNTYTLSGALSTYGFQCDSTQIISDDYNAIKSGIAGDLNQCDVLLLSGGISVGEYDFVKKALEANKVEEQFYKVLQKPGKPLYFGRMENKFVFALPGNPASSLTCFYIHVLPLLQKLSGGHGIGLKRIEVPLKEDFHFKFDRPTFLKALVKNGEVKILDGQGSSMIHSMAIGNALVFLDSARWVKEGEFVQTIIL